MALLLQRICFVLEYWWLPLDSFQRRRQERNPYQWGNWWAEHVGLRRAWDLSYIFCAPPCPICRNGSVGNPVCRHCEELSRLWWEEQELPGWPIAKDGSDGNQPR